MCVCVCVGIAHKNFYSIKSYDVGDQAECQFPDGLRTAPLTPRHYYYYYYYKTLAMMIIIHLNNSAHVNLHIQ